MAYTRPLQVPLQQWRTFSIVLAGGELHDEASILAKMVPCDSSYGVGRIHEVVSNIFKYILSKQTNVSRKQYREYVRTQLLHGGGKLFKHISIEDKRFLNVHWCTHSKTAKNCKEFLGEQCNEWGNKYWNPKDILNRAYNLSLIHI